MIISIGIILPACINLFNADIISKAETSIVVPKIASLGIVLVTGARFVDGSQVNPENWSNPLSLIAAGMVIFGA